MLLHQNLGLEGFFIYLEDGQHGAVTLLMMLVCVEAIQTIAAMTNLIAAKTIAV